MGKGGDLKKWQSARIQLYVGLDIAAVSIEQAAERYGSMGRVRFAGYFFVADCYSVSVHISKSMGADSI